MAAGTTAAVVGLLPLAINGNESCGGRVARVATIGPWESGGGESTPSEERQYAGVRRDCIITARALVATFAGGAGSVTYVVLAKLARRRVGLAESDYRRDGR